MPVDPKIRAPAGMPLTRPQLATAPLPLAPRPLPAKPNAAPAPGYGNSSRFDTVQRGGASDDGVGRSGMFAVSDGRNKGAADDGVGRKKGAADDGVGRKKGAADDGVGTFEAARNALVGPASTPDGVALHKAISERLETPSFLKGAASVAAQVYDFAKHTLKLSSTQAGQLTTALKGASADTAKLLGALIEKAPEALSTVDARGETLLANLARFAAQPLNPKLASDTTKQELLSSLLRDVVNPNSIDQGDAPTCTVTSMQFELVADEPAEYLRLMTDLCGPQGASKMRGGSELQAQRGDAAAGVRDGRSVSQALFQTAAMEFGNGRNLAFDAAGKGSLNAKGEMVQRGLKPEQQTQVLRQLFGVNYRSELFQTAAEGAKALEKLRTYDSREAQNRPVILQIDQGSFNHAVTFERVADQRVYFRDPYGALRSMPENQFKDFVVGINAPKDLNIVA